MTFAARSSWNSGAAAPAPPPPPPAGTWVVEFDLTYSSTVSFEFLAGATNATVDWRDGTIETFTVEGIVSHTYAAVSGTVEVWISGTCSGLDFGGGITAITTWDVGLTTLVEISTYYFTSVPNYIPADITRITFPFCGNFNSAGVVTWDTSNITDMSYMFDNATAFNQDISGWNTSAVTDMTRMFHFAETFNQNIGTWDTGAVTSMSEMFLLALAFDGDIGAWNTSAVTDMTRMFQFASVFNQNIGLWDITAVTSVYEMFFDAIAFNGDIGAWDTSNLTSMYSMFEGCTAFNQDISAWDTSAVTTMQQMFYRAEAFNQPIGSWNTSAVTSMYRMFEGAYAFNGDISAWDTSAVTNMLQMFREATVFNQPIGIWDTSAVTNMDSMFRFATVFDQDLTNWDVTLIVTPPSLFADASALTLSNYPIWGTAGASVTFFAAIFASDPVDSISPAAPATVTLAGGTITYADKAVITPVATSGVITSIGWDVGGTLSPKLSVDDAAYTGKTVTLSVRARRSTPISSSGTGTVRPFFIYVSAGVTYGFASNSISGALRTLWYLQVGATVTSGNIASATGAAKTYALVWDSAGTSLTWQLDGVVVNTLATSRVAGRPYVQVVRPTTATNGVTAMEFNALQLAAV